MLPQVTPVFLSARNVHGFWTQVYYQDSSALFPRMTHCRAHDGVRLVWGQTSYTHFTGFLFDAAQEY